MDNELLNDPNRHKEAVQRNIERESQERAEFEERFTRIPLTGLSKRINDGILTPEIDTKNPDTGVWDNKNYWMAQFFRVVLKRIEVMKVSSERKDYFLPK